MPTRPAVPPRPHALPIRPAMPYEAIYARTEKAQKAAAVRAVAQTKAPAPVKRAAHIKSRAAKPKPQLKVKAEVDEGFGEVRTQG